MQTILYATDFSKSAANAGKLALIIARAADAKLLVYNAYSIPVLDSTVPGSLYEELIDEKHKEVEDNLIRICQKFTAERTVSGKQLYCEHFSEQGIAADKISSVATGKQADLIVTASRNENSVLRFLGSTALTIASKASCPVIAVPYSKVPESIKHILLAIDFRKADMDAFDKVFSFAELFNAKVTLLHISQNDKYEKGLQKMEQFKQKVLGKYNSGNVSFEVISYKDEWSAIESYVSESKADIISLVRHDIGIFEGLFHESLIDMALNKSHLPLMILNEKFLSK
ncbi:MAG: universal stress protein [Cytophagaceae bacterium]